MKGSVVDFDTSLSRKEATIIKMDIEGAELKALKAAEKNIKRHFPFNERVVVYASVSS